MQERVVREIRTLRAKWRGLETGLRTTLLGHEERKLGYRQGETYDHRASARPYQPLRENLGARIADFAQLDLRCLAVDPGRMSGNYFTSTIFLVWARALDTSLTK